MSDYVVLRYVSSEPVRGSANPNSASLGNLANGKQLELMQEAAVKYNDYTWYFKVVFNNKTGYIRTRYMDEVRPGDYFALQPDYSKYANYVRVVCAGNLNVRTSADLNSATNILPRKAEHGDVLALKSLAQANGCWQVEFDGRAAYVSAGTAYTERIDPTAIPGGNGAAQNVNCVKVICSGNLNVRGNADINSKTNILGTAKPGAVLTLKSTTQINGCWQVEWNGQTAYVCAGTAYTERVNSAASPGGNTAAQSAAWAAIVNQKNQTVSVYKNKALIRFCACTTGGTTKDRLTPVGTFTHKEDMNGLPGKKSLFLSWHTSDASKKISGVEDLTVFDCVRITGAVYFHRVPRQASSSYDYYKARLNAAGSLGCIRLPEVHSRWMYENFAYGGVTVVQSL
ncbi:MAG: L,D-transpeptidase [Clostridia bacterium]|nr:L,D-transpeptidase [Clostridia bacterium]